MSMVTVAFSIDLLNFVAAAGGSESDGCALIIVVCVKKRLKPNKFWRGNVAVVVP